MNIIKILFIINMVIVAWQPATANVKFIHLNSEPAIPNGFGGDFDENGARDPEIVWTGDSLRLYYTAVGRDDVERIALAESQDMVNWNSLGVVWSPEDAGTFADNGVFAPSVVKSAGGYELYYTANSSGWFQIGKAVSHDGYNFQRPLGTAAPVLAASYTPDSFDQIGVGHPGVVRVGNYTFMIYQGYDGSIWKRLGFAYSLDGNHFQRFAGSQGFNAVFGPGPHGFDDAGALEPELIMVGGDIRMFYTSIHY